MDNKELWVSSLPGVHATQLNLVYLTTCFAAPQPSSAIYSEELWQTGPQAPLVQEQVLHVLQVGNSLLAGLRPAWPCSLAVVRVADLFWSSVLHVEHESDSAAAEQLPRMRNGSFVRPTGPQEKQSSSQGYCWHESWDHIKSGPFAAAFYQQQTSL